jgi:hypothetical protein
MSAPTSDLYRETIRKALMGRAGNAPDASVVAKVTLDIWHQMAVGLAPVIGTRGVNVLFSRSLHLTGKAFPSLVIAGDHGDNAAMLGSLKSRLAGGKTKDAMEASCALMVTFTDLLSTMIGQSLTEKLLRPVWALPSPTSDQEIDS